MFGDIAQLGERTTEVHQESNRAVPGSIPGGANLFVNFDMLQPCLVFLNFWKYENLLHSSVRTCLFCLLDFSKSKDRQNFVSGQVLSS